MNCKQGDLAIYVRSTAGNEGRIVRCVQFVPNLRFTFPGGDMNMPAWKLDKPARAWNGKMATHAPDAFLRPIRPGDISDEEVRDLYAPKVPEAA